MLTTTSCPLKSWLLARLLTHPLPPYLQAYLLTYSFIKFSSPIHSLSDSFPHLHIHWSTPLPNVAVACFLACQPTCMSVDCPNQIGDAASTTVTTPRNLVNPLTVCFHACSISSVWLSRLLFDLLVWWRFYRQSHLLTHSSTHHSSTCAGSFAQWPVFFCDY